MPTSKQRREAQRRRLQRQLARRQRRAATRRRNTLIASVVGTIVVIAVVVFFIVQTGNDNKKPARPAAHHHKSTPTPTATTSAGRTPTYPCDWTKSGTAARKVTVPATTKPPRQGKVSVSVRTTRGNLTFTLDRAAAPCTVASFVSLVQQKYYDDTSCQRLTTAGSYILQCGDPTGTGSGGPGYTIPDEATGKEAYLTGTLAMARQETPHSGGSQFFIVYKNSPDLMQGRGQQQYTVFGKVTSGLSVVTRVAGKGADPSGDGKPKLPITISSMRTAA